MSERVDEVRERVARFIDTVLDGARDMARDDAGDDALAAKVSALEVDEMRALEEAARGLLKSTPTPIRAEGTPELTKRRRALERICALIEAHRGNDDPLFALERSAFREGKSPLGYVRALLRRSMPDHAAAAARLVLSNPDCQDRAALEKVLSEIAQAPDGWSDAVAAFALAPSIAAFETLMRFVPADAYYHRLRTTLALLVKLGVDPDLVFRFATKDGVVPDAIDLIEEGLVSPEAIVLRARSSTPDGVPIWLALAARAAWARRDRFNAVRLTREAYDALRGSFGRSAEVEVRRLRDDADEELHTMLDAAGIPRFDSDA
jgi:hypothetical protein